MPTISAVLECDFLNKNSNECISNEKFILKKELNKLGHNNNDVSTSFNNQKNLYVFF